MTDLLNQWLGYRPYPCKKVRKALRKLGFKPDKGKGTSHDQYRKTVNGRLYKVTLDCHKGEVKAKDLRSIISQSGVPRNQFVKVLQAC